MWKKRNLVHCWECKLVQPVWKTLWKFLKKLKIELPFCKWMLPFHQSYSLFKFLGGITKKLSQFVLSDDVTPSITGTLFNQKELGKLKF